MSTDTAKLIAAVMDAQNGYELQDAADAFAAALEAAEAQRDLLVKAAQRVEDEARAGKIAVESVGGDSPVWVVPNVAIHHIEIVRSIIRNALAAVEPPEEQAVTPRSEFGI